MARRWKKSGDVTLLLWKVFTTTLNSSNSDNPMHVSWDKKSGSQNVVNAGASATDAPTLVIAILVVFSLVSRIWLSGTVTSPNLQEFAEAMRGIDF